MSSTTDTTAPVETPKVKTPKWTPLDAAAAKAIATSARPAINPCLCGCGETTKGRFYPGHDALLKETLRVTVASGTAPAQTAAKAALATFGWEV